jgi:hypothetical protein
VPHSSNSDSITFGRCGQQDKRNRKSQERVGKYKEKQGKEDTISTEHTEFGIEID